MKSSVAIAAMNAGIRCRAIIFTELVEMVQSRWCAGLSVQRCKGWEENFKTRPVGEECKNLI